MANGSRAYLTPTKFSTNFTSFSSDPSFLSERGLELFPIWILCESVSALSTLIATYILLVLIRHTRKQDTRRLARKQRDSALFSPRFMQNTKWPVYPDASSAAAKTSEEFDPHHVRQDTAKKNKISLQEQISVESTKSNSNLITSNGHDPQEYRGVIAVHRTKEKDRGVWLLRAIVLCVFVVVLRGLLEQCLILIGHFSDTICDGLTKAMVALTALSLHCCHVFLWLRQLTFYSNPVLKPLRSKRLKVLSYAAYGIMPVTLTITLALYMTWRDYKSIHGVCMASDKQNFSTYVPFGVLVACTVTIQILLSTLFLYPLIDHKIKRNQLKKANKGSDVHGTLPASTPVTRRPRSKDKLMACIKRVLYGATVGITTDLVGGLVSMFLPIDIPMYAYGVLYNLNVSLNVLCLIYTFANWRQMLFPWCCPSPDERGFRASKRRRRSSGKSGTFDRRTLPRNSSFKNA